MALNDKLDSLEFIQQIQTTFDENGSSREFKKGEFLIREGEIERNLFRIEKGAVRIFYLSEFEEKTIRLGYDGTVMNSLSSYLTGQPSEFFIQALRKTTVKVIQKETVDQMIQASQEILRSYCQFLELLLSQQLDREIDLLIASPAKRLERVLKRSPYLFQHIPLKYIASYLRMEPETLSRIRNS